MTDAPAPQPLTVFGELVEERRHVVTFSCGHCGAPPCVLSDQRAVRAFINGQELDATCNRCSGKMLIVRRKLVT